MMNTSSPDLGYNPTSGRSIAKIVPKSLWKGPRLP